MGRRRGVFAAAVLMMAAGVVVKDGRAEIGVFADHRDVGTVLHPGSARFDAGAGTYTVSGSGENMWFGADAFHFVYKKMSGDVAITADIAFAGTGGNNHRKAALLLRQSLEPGAKYVDVAVHGDGLTSLQYRDAPGADTHEVESAVEAPRRVRIERRGSYVYVSVADATGRLVPSGAAIKIALEGEIYVGLGVCSHDKGVTETATFRNVTIEALPVAVAKPVLYSTLETVTVASTDRRVAYVAAEHFEAPNWAPDGKSLLMNQDGTLRRLAITRATPVAVSAPVVVATGTQVKCNNDHGLSPQGDLIAFSDSSAADGASRVYVVAAEGGTPRQVTATGPSYWHGWSPDGTTLAFTGERGGEFDIYTMPAAGAGAERRLTTAKGLDDGPEYAPDGRSIFFNSERTGHMQIWRMNEDGSKQEQVLTEESNDWFPHISPDGTLMIFLAYGAGVNGHPSNQDVELRVMSLSDKKVRVLAKLFGGQGTINVPSWSPDSTKVAFVSYELLPQ